MKLLHATRLNLFPLLVFLLLTVGCSENNTKNLRKDADTFLADYSGRYVKLYTENESAQWQANVMIVPGDSTNAKRANAAAEALADFTGSQENVTLATDFLMHADQLSDLQRRQLEKILYMAGNNPAVAGELVPRRIAAENAQNGALYGFEFTVNGKPISANEIDQILRESSNINERLRVWRSSKEVGIGLKDGLANLAELRNGTVQALGYEDFFQYMASDYGMSTDELLALTDQLNQELRPLYRELHTWARYELAKRYQQPVPEQLPAHWLPNRWGQEWSPVLTVEGLDLDAALQGKSAESIVHAGEDFYVSLGYPQLPETFWQRSSLYPLQQSVKYKKNNHASAWHINLEDDVRCLMSVEPDADWWETVHHEFGHIYYFLAYSNSDVPPLLRDGANRAFHEAVGSLLGFASKQQPFLAGRGLVAANAQVDPMQSLLKEALLNVVFIPWSAGVMTQFEHALYADNLSEDHFNEYWWRLKLEYQGIVPPEPRGEEFCDAASKTHINNHPASYYSYALSEVLLHQLHEYISTTILKQDPHATDYFGSTETGEFLWSILEQGATVDSDDLLREKTGSGLSASAMLEYYEPLYEWLVVQNKGRTDTLPELNDLVQ
ncbi:M2 family metallopeptidase [bacterium]|nr:M2 family metallopeptidase [bacterium]